MPEVKQPATYEEQIVLLRKHGCIINDETDCRDKLSSIGYYRLSAYFLPFRRDDGTYSVGTAFDTVYRIYEFDRRFRNLLFSALEVIEISLRSRLSYFHSSRYGALGYKNPTNFNPRHDHERFEKNLEREIANNGCRISITTSGLPIKRHSPMKSVLTIIIANSKGGFVAVLTSETYALIMADCIIVFLLQCQQDLILPNMPAVDCGE